MGQFGSRDPEECDQKMVETVRIPSLKKYCSSSSWIRLELIYKKVATHAGLGLEFIL